MWSKIEIASDTWFVQRDWRSCNHFIARTPQLTLIDTGYGKDIDDTVAALRSVGAEPEDVELILNTHCHCDHVGGNAFFAEHSGCEIWMHSFEKARIQQRDDIGTWWRFHDTWADFFNVHRALEDGDELRFGSLDLRVIHAPGHTGGLIMFYSEARKALFSTDALWQGDMGVINTIVEGADALERAVATVEGISRLDIDTVYPGHGPIISSPKPAIDRLLRRLDAYGRNPTAMHIDHLKKMAAYIVLTKDGIAEEELFPYLMAGTWFPRVVNDYFQSSYREVYQMVIEQTTRSRMIKLENGRFVGTGQK